MSAHEVFAIAYKAGVVAHLPQPAGAMVGGIDVADVVPSKRLHGARHDARPLWRPEQMDVVGHQHLGMHQTPFATGTVSKFTAVKEVVLDCEKAWLMVVAALDDMLRNFREFNTQWARHGDGLHGYKRTG